jgi:hypothetical protein
MEDVMETSVARQRQPHSHVIDQVCDVVGSDIAGLELPNSGARKRRCSPLPETKKGPITDLVHDQPVRSVIVALLDGLRLPEQEADVGEKRLLCLHLLGHRIDPRLARLVGADGGWVTPIDHPE